MTGNKVGGMKTAKTNLERHGKDFYRHIGRMGGRASTRGGFASDKIGKDGLTGRQRSRLCGQKIGRITKRGCHFLGIENGMAKYERSATGEIFTTELYNLGQEHE